jgi:hypothetical protein
MSKAEIYGGELSRFVDGGDATPAGNEPETTQAAPPRVPVVVAEKRKPKGPMVDCRRLYGPRGELTTIIMTPQPGWAIDSVVLQGPFNGTSRTCRVGIVTQRSRGKPRKRQAREDKQNATH